MLDEATQGRWLHRCQTLEELAEHLEVDASGLLETITQWNRGAEPFGRARRPMKIEAPPFWGVRCIGGMLLSRGGPRVDSMLRPLVAGRPLYGVHCVGELLGMGQFTGNNFAGGMSVGPALSLGRWIVRALAARGSFR